jgi:putative ABC transport system permease protein
VAVLGITSTATSQIGKSFDLMRDTTVTVNDVGASTGGRTGDATMDFPPDADSRLTRLNGVVSAGVWWTIPLHKPTIAPTPNTATAPPEASSLPLFAVSPGALGAMQPTLSTGTLFNAFHQERAEPVCLLGTAAAHLLGITRVDTQPAIFIDDRAYTVLGIMSNSQSLSQMLMGIVIPDSTALAAYGPPTDTPAQAFIRTRVGAGQLIARQAALALRPDQPNLLQAVPPPDPHSLRDQVSNDLSSLFLLLAGICLIIGAVGIANTTLVSVLERTGEIGLRRALGARPRHIAAQFLTESTSLGLMGGLVGTSLGVATVLITSLVQHWTTILQPYTVYLAPVVGAAVGLAAGLYPALRAARTEPLEALRR